MTTKTTITCDACGKDITTHDTGYDLFRLELRVKNIPSTFPIRYATFSYPPDANKDFCDLGCLLAWLKKQSISTITQE